MMSASLYYRPSGRMGGASIPMMIISAAIAAPLLAAVYGYAIYFIPFVYLNFFITVFFGVLLGVAVSFAARAGKCRNPAAAGTLALLAGLAGVYLSWVAWFHAGTGSLLLAPGELWSAIRLIAAYGPWTIFGWTPTGGAAYAIWGLEALMIVGIPVIHARAAIADTPFCESCERWLSQVVSLAPLQGLAEPEAARQRLEQGDVEALRSLAPAAAGAADTTQVQLRECGGCKRKHYLTVKSVTVTGEGKKEKRSETTLLENLALSAEAHTALSGVGQRA